MDRSPQTNWLPPIAPQPAAPAPAAGPTPAPAPPAPGPAPPRGHGGLRRLIGPLLLIGALLFKYGKAALLILPKAKVLTTSASMLVSVAAYALIWGWRFAVGFVALLFVHELGHYLQLRREGVKPSGMLFIPFLGAVVGARSLGGSALAEARVGLAGPVVGTLGAALVALWAVAVDSDFLRALAFTGFLLNLFNLLPVSPLDGGRAMAALAPWMWFVGLGIVAVLAFTWPNPIILLILLVGAFETYRRWKHRKQGLEGNPAYYQVPPRARLAVGAVYLGLIVALVLGMDATFVERDLSDA